MTETNSPTVPTAVPLVTAAPVVPGYEIEHELGRGGTGVVYLARQASLNRRVALKVLRDAEAGDAATRFRAEAEAIARLRHPNIVQIYEVGETAVGPHLVLEYAEGGSLADLLTGAPLPARAAAELVETLARAVHTAHEQKIVHRDLKPDNVLLVPAEGRAAAGPAADTATRLTQFIPKLGDFGLVKRLDGTRHTTTGVVVGTPSYMAPEQAAGRPDVGPGADVYALGAILYELITGRPPFVGPTPLETVLQVIGDEPVTPRELQPRLPRDLETVCLMCLRKSPGRRYPTAAALADDLARFLASRPIWARPTGWTERLVKWARRRPAAAIGAAAGWVLLAAGTAFGAQLHWTAEEARRSEATANQEREISRAQEQAARDAVAEFYTQVSENRLLREPGMEGLRRELLAKSADFYQRFVATQRDAPAVRAELARARLRLAALAGDLGAPAEGLTHAATAEGEFQELLSLNPDAALAADSARAAEVRGDLHRAAGDGAKAATAYLEARARWEGLAAAEPNAPEWAVRLAGVAERLAAVYGSEGRAEDALKELDVAEKRLAPLREPAGQTELLVRRAAGRALAAELLSGQGRDEEAEARARGAVELWDEVVRTGGAALPPDRAADRAAAWHRLGLVLADAARPGESVEAFKKALEMYRRLTRDHGAVPGYRLRLARCLGDLARVHAQQEQTHLSEPLATEAQALADELAERYPHLPDFGAEAARSRDVLLPWYGATSRGPMLDAEAKKAGDIWADLCARFPTRADLSDDRARHLLAVAEGYTELTYYGTANRTPDAETAYREAVRAADARAPRPGAVGAGETAARAVYGLGLLSLRAGRDADAVKHLTSARERFAALVTSHPRVGRFRARAADAADVLATVHGEYGRSAEGVQLARAALGEWEALAKDHPATLLYQLERARAHTRLGNRLLDDRRTAEALAEYRTSARLRGELLAGPVPGGAWHGTDTTVRRELTRTLFTIEEMALELGRPDDARAAVREALDNHGPLVKAYPNVPAYRDGLAECHYRLAEHDRRAGKLAAAEEGFHRALAIRAPLAGAYPTERTFVFNHAGDCAGLARVALRRGRSDSAVDWAGRAVAGTEAVLKTTPNWAPAVHVLRGALRVRATVALLKGRAADAAGDLRRWRELARGTERSGVEVVFWLAERGAGTAAGLLALACEWAID